MSGKGLLLDTGPLVALLSKDDQDNERAKELFSLCQGPFMTCEAVVTETCFLLSKVHPEAPAEVLSLGQNGLYKIPLFLKDHWSPVRDLLQKYKDRPISLADACLIRCAEIHNEPRILTFDSDFEFYRWGRNKKFEILK